MSAATLTPNATVEYLEGLATARKTHPTEDRSEQRYRANTLASFTVDDQPGENAARVVNLSTSGLGLRLSERLPRGMMIRVCVGRIQVLGEIRWCRSTADGYRAGLKTLEVTEAPLSD